jgi:hypothetical protein
VARSQYTRSNHRGSQTSVAELLDRVLGVGAVAAGDVILSVADVDLVYLNVRALLASVDALRDGAPQLPVASGTWSAGPAAPATRKAPGQVTGSGRGWAEQSPPDSGGGLQALERFARRADSVLGGLTRIHADPEHVEKGLAGLVLTVVELLRELMERQAIRRLEAGSLTPDQVERLGQTFLRLNQRMAELREEFGLSEEDIDLRIPLGTSTAATW